MFERMVLSGAGRRDRRLSKFFVGSSLAYLLLAGSALAVSICVSDPKLLGSNAGTTIKWVAVPTGSNEPSSRPPSGGGGGRVVTPRQNLNTITPLDRLPSHVDPAPPSLHPIEGPSDQEATQGGPGIGGGDSSIPGYQPGTGSGDAPPQPMARRVSQPTVNQHPRNNAPVNVSQPVLQGKAIYRKTPEYPAVARTIRIEGPVVVEVVISPEGLVESARAISGHPLLAPTAVAAARDWRFQPTYLGNVAVRVAGAITFVFKLGQ